MNELRIIGGQFRGRRIRFVPHRELRPTLDMVRETLFNWLMWKVKGSYCLDAFAGSGALGFEALSRFAKSVLFIEFEKIAVNTLNQNSLLLGCSDAVQVLQDSSLNFLATAEVKQPFDLIFLDPPFATSFLGDALRLIEKRQWLAPGGYIYFEAARSLDVRELATQYWAIYRYRMVGEVQFGLLQHSDHDKISSI